MKMDDIKPEDVMKSLSMEENRRNVFKAGEGAGQSGSFFFFSKDNRFLIKTMRGSEKRVMLNMLDCFIDHLRATKNKSMLARIYGIFTIKTNLFAPMDVIIMQNTANITNKNGPKMTFDLKGSTINRRTRLTQAQNVKITEEQTCDKILKDLNYITICSEQR